MPTLPSDLNVESTPASNEPVDKAVFDFEWTGQIAGFSVKGHFSYDKDEVNTTGIVREEDLLTFDVSFFAPDGNLLRTYEDNHINFDDFNFAFNTETQEILQDGTYNVDDDVDQGRNGFLFGEGDPALRSEPGSQEGLAFWSRPRDTAVPHLHVDDWSDEFGFPIGFSSHEDVAFFTRTTQDLIDTDRVGETYIDQLQDSLDEVGQRIEVTPVLPPEPPELIERTSFEPIFGTNGDDVIEVKGSNQLIFAGAGNDLVDASIASKGGNRVYLGNGDDVGVLGQGDRYSGGIGDDQFYTTTGGDNTVTGGEGADQFWVAVAEIPTNVLQVEAGEGYYTFAGDVSSNSDVRLLSDKATAIGFEGLDTISFLHFDQIPVEEIESALISAELQLEHDAALTELNNLIPATEDRPVNVSTYTLEEGTGFDPINGNVDDIDYGVNGTNAFSSTSVGADGVYGWDITALLQDELTHSSDGEVNVVLSGVFGNTDTDGRNSYAAFYPVGETDSLPPTLVITTEAINTITDFTSGEDVIGIAGFGIGFENIDRTQQGDDALIGINGINFALLENVDINDLSASDFAFA